MPFNNYSNYGNYGAYQSPVIPNNVRPTVPANNGNYAYNTGLNGNYMNNGFPTNPAPVQDDRWVFTDYVSGRAGADAYQMPDGMSGRRMRNPMNGQYMSGNGMYREMGRNGSGTYYHPYMDDGMYYDGSYNDMRSSGRRYYDSEKEKAIHKLHHMMENEDNAEKKNALKLAITELEQK